MTQAYPLHWPAGWPRTPAHQRRDSKHTFRRADPRRPFWTFAEARDALMDQLERIGARQPVLSSNYELRLDGLPRGGQSAPWDTGIAVYFTLKGRPKVMACDRHERAEENMRSIALAIEAMRQLERHGGGHMLDAAFQGFTALPAPISCWEVLGLADGPRTESAIREAHRRLVRAAAADNDGDRLARANLARDEALREIANA